MNWMYIVQQDITTLNVECVVNAANEDLLAGGGVCEAIFKEAGYENLEKACEEIGHCDTGSAVITPGFNLKADHIIHAVGPKWQGGQHDEKKLLYNCYCAAMQLAQEKGCKSVGFPLISSGIFGYPKQEAWEVALSAVNSCKGEEDMDIYFAVIDYKTYELGRLIYMSMFDNPY